MNIFKKGNYKPIPPNFRIKGFSALEELTKFQKEFNIWDTDTTINEIRDSIVANYLGFDLLNFDKHGFDAKKSEEDKFLEVKQCSFFSKSWSGTWNDTNEEKAKAFMTDKVYTALGIWKGASDLQFIVFGQNRKLGEYLLEKIKDAKENRRRSTQTISINKMIKEYGFDIIIPPDKDKKYVYNLLIMHNRSFFKILKIDNLKSIEDVAI